LRLRYFGNLHDTYARSIYGKTTPVPMMRGFLTVPDVFYQMKQDLERVTWVCRTEGDMWMEGTRDACFATGAEGGAGAYVVGPSNDKVFVCPGFIDDLNSSREEWRLYLRRILRRMKMSDSVNAKEKELTVGFTQLMIHELAQVARRSSSK
jgi:hypothetical protein